MSPDRSAPSHELPRQRDELTPEAYAAELAALVAPVRSAREAVRVPCAEAAGQVLAEPVLARADVPSADNSAMDGYALRWADAEEALSSGTAMPVVGEVAAGSLADPPLEPGQCVRIMTGAPLPAAADSVVQVELTDGGLREMRLRALPDQGQSSFVRRAGSDTRAGSSVLAAGSLLTPRACAAVAAAGAGEVAVRRPLRVAVLSTGDELVVPGRPLARGQVYESNSAYLIPALTALGCEIVNADPIPVGDRVSELVESLDVLAQDADVILLSGGVSVGAHDVVRIALEQHAQARFVAVTMQPGKPQGWARWRDQTPIICLPGNPVSVAVSFEVLVAEALSGQPGPPWLPAVAATAWRSPAGRRQYLPAVIETAPHGIQVRPAHAGGSASHLVTSLVAAEALAEVPADVVDVQPGQPLRVRMWA